MSTLQRDMVSLDMLENDRYEYERWLDKKELEMLAQESFWDEVQYGRIDREVRNQFFNENPLEAPDSPDIPYPER
jgi:hypothetical protein